MIKSYIIFSSRKINQSSCNSEFKKTHFVGKILLDKLESIELQQDWKEKIAKIAKIAIEIEPEFTWSRYPGIDQGSLWLPYEEYTEEDAIRVKSRSEEVLKVAKDFIK